MDAISVGNLPPEVWMLVFSWACMDHGYTGRSLSLVSRQVRSLSEPYKLQSLGVSRSKFIIRLSNILLGTPSQLRRVRYLFLGSSYVLVDTSESELDEDYSEDSGSDVSDEASDSHTSASQDSSVDFEAELSPQDVRDLFEDVDFVRSPEGQPVLGPMHSENPMARSGSEEIEIGERLLYDAIFTILQLCSTSLFALNIDVSSLNTMGPFIPFPVPLPSLSSLTLFCKFAIPPYRQNDDGLDPVINSKPILFPSLTYMHIGSTRWAIQVFPLIKHFAPRLTRLRIPYERIFTFNRQVVQCLPCSLTEVTREVPVNERTRFQGAASEEEIRRRDGSIVTQNFPLGRLEEELRDKRIALPDIMHEWFRQL